MAPLKPKGKNIPYHEKEVSLIHRMVNKAQGSGAVIDWDAIATKNEEENGVARKSGALSQHYYHKLKAKAEGRGVSITARGKQRAVALNARPALPIKVMEREAPEAPDSDGLKDYLDNTVEVVLSGVLDKETGKAALLKLLSRFNKEQLGEIALEYMLKR